MRKLIWWFWLTAIIFVVFIVIPFISLFFEPKITTFFFEHMSLIDIKFKSEYKSLWLIFDGVNIIIYFVALTDLNSVYNHLYKKLITFRTIQGQYTTNLETRKLRNKIGWTSVWYTFFKSYVLKLFVWIGFCNLLLIGLMHNDWQKGLLVAIGFWIAGWASNQLGGDLDEKVIIMQEAAEAERRNRSEHRQMQDYIQDARYQQQQQQHPPQYPQYYAPPPPQYYAPPPPNYYYAPPPPPQGQHYVPPGETNTGTHGQQQAPESLDQVISQQSRANHSSADSESGVSEQFAWLESDLKKFSDGAKNFLNRNKKRPF